MVNDNEMVAMRRVIALSALARGTTSPNPLVGCVIVKGGGSVVGEGYHVRKGGPHAEGRALAAAGPLARGATAVVTLEPCNHVGRAPACRQLLLDAGVARVVIAVMDPTSRGAARPCWRSGARTLLLNTGTPTDERYLDRGCVDALVQVLEPGTNERAEPVALLPPSFEIHGIGRRGGAVIVQARAVRVP